MRKPKSTEELAKQLEQETDNDEFWNQQSAKIEARPSRTSVLSLRLPTDEFRSLLRAARNAGESVSTYVRKAIAMRLMSQPASPVVNISYSYVGITGKDEPQEWNTYTSGTEPKSSTVPAKVTSNA